jgi:hypothetical protein
MFEYMATRARIWYHMPGPLTCSASRAIRRCQACQVTGSATEMQTTKYALLYLHLPGWRMVQDQVFESVTEWTVLRLWDPGALST